MRVTDHPAFTVTGVDFTGELYVKSEISKETKRYVCLFTCATTRGVHLELVENMSTGAFLRAFRRFAARRSLPHRMLSDNASTYHAAAKEIHEIMNSPSVRGFLANHLVQWDFIPKRAPWFGGFWERLIGITKLCLKKVLRRAFIYEDELRTLLTEIEAVINDRPLTTVRRLQRTPTSNSVATHRRSNNYHFTVRRHQRRRTTRSKLHVANRLGEEISSSFRLLEQFHARWSNEYLTALKERDFNCVRGSTTNEIKVGDVVLIHDSQKKRAQWKLAIVQKLNAGNDGLVRSAEIKTANGPSNRPITKLHPLEINTGDVNGTSPSTDDCATTNHIRRSS
ncbi:uncharacterized protein [Ptychodera flava]|uniref:uncharacterized protein n=1 Tax=Ptychodera flava TaxID=63121 RepID=UPI00396A732B